MSKQYKLQFEVTEFDPGTEYTAVVSDNQGNTYTSKTGTPEYGVNELDAVVPTTSEMKIQIESSGGALTVDSVSLLKSEYNY